jgi:hypothetical protein
LAAASSYSSSCTWPALLPCLANNLLLTLTLPALLALTAIVQIGHPACLQANFRFLVSDAVDVKRFAADPDLMLGVWLLLLLGGNVAAAAALLLLLLLGGHVAAAAALLLLLLGDNVAAAG